MKLRSVGLLVAVVAMGFSLAACGCFQQAMRGEEAPPAPEAAAAPAPEEAPPPPEAAPAPAPEPEAAAAPAVELEDINFDFDKYDIRPGDAELLKKNYEWFGANPGRVRIEGNCDERGTTEYNLGLGQRRADATKEFLINLGVDAGRLDTISYGKERPIDPGHNEEAWAKNRRAHFTPLGE